MQQVYVHKDVSTYEEKIIGKLSGRVLVCLAGGVAVSVASAAIFHFGLGFQIADVSLPVMASSVPFWLAGFWKPKDMLPEKFIPLAAEHALNNGKVIYRASYANNHGAKRKLGRKGKRAQRKLARSWRRGGECDV